VKRSCEIKAQVVGQDERESGMRAILNFGHTFGHAIEAGLGYGEWLHGEAVGCGMVMAIDLSRRLGLVDAAYAQRLTDIVRRAGLPVRGPGARAGPVSRAHAPRQEGRSRRDPLRRHRVHQAAPACGPAPDDLVREVVRGHAALIGREPRGAAGVRERPGPLARPAPSVSCPAPTRDDFQRDRDRIVHSTAFRRLGLQDPGLPQSRGRLVPHSPHAFARGRPARPLDRPVAGA
jgi:hypothetical protein